MIDDDDVGFVALLFSDFRGWAGFILFTAAVGLCLWIASSNADECEAKSCPNSQRAELLDGRCVCVTEAK